MKQIAKMLLMVVLAIDLICFSTLSTNQLDKTDVPLTYPASVISTEQVCPPNKVQVSEQLKQDSSGPPGPGTHYHCTLLVPNVPDPVQPCCLLQYTPHQLSLWLLLGQELQWVCSAGLL